MTNSEDINATFAKITRAISLICARIFRNKIGSFEQWVLGKQTIKQLCRSSGYSEKSLRNWFDSYLKHYPEWEISRREKVNLMIDGTYYPKSVAGKYLRSLASAIHTIKSCDDRDYWLCEFHLWESVFHDYITEKSYSEGRPKGWDKHKMLRKSYVHIRRALPYMFHFLDNPNIPNNTNSLESFFGHLKQNISLHRGLSKEHYKNYVKWYLYFRNKDNKK